MRVSPTAGRIAWLLEKLWRGHQTEMARDIGIPQGTLSNILCGKREPGPKVLQAIAAHPLVNLDWLCSGVGEPLAVSTAYLKGVVPLATSLLSGLPSGNRHLLANVGVEVPASVCRPSVYAVEAAGCERLLTARNEALLPRDHIVIEADTSTWRKDPWVLNQRLCVVVKGRQALTWLARVTCARQPGHLRKAKTVLSAYAPHTVVSTFHDEYGKELRTIQVDASAKVHQTDVPNRVVKVDIAQIVGVAVYLIRVL